MYSQSSFKHLETLTDALACDAYYILYVVFHVVHGLQLIYLEYLPQHHFIHAVIKVLFIGENDERYFSLLECRRFGHVHEYFLHYRQPFSVCSVYHEEYAVDIWVEKLPIFSVSSLRKYD